MTTQIDVVDIGVVFLVRYQDFRVVREGQLFHLWSHSQCQLPGFFRLAQVLLPSFLEIVQWFDHHRCIRSEVSRYSW